MGEGACRWKKSHRRCLQCATAFKSWAYVPRIVKAANDKERGIFHLVHDNAVLWLVVEYTTSPGSRAPRPGNRRNGASRGGIRAPRRPTAGTRLPEPHQSGAGVTSALEPSPGTSEISVISFFSTASAKVSKVSATMWKALGPPITLFM